MTIVIEPMLFFYLALLCFLCVAIRWPKQRFVDLLALGLFFLTIWLNHGVVIH